MTMYRRYRSEHSNQLHQLLVSVSRHFYVRKDGLLRYQEKPMDANINTCRKSSREHLVYYIMRDHFSGNFVFRLATSKSLLPLADFLYLAWSKESEEKHFWGLPDIVFVPRTISTPGLLEGLKKLGVEPVNPPSGFASGVRIIRDLEQYIHYVLGDIIDRRVENISSYKDNIYKYLLDLPLGEESKVARWKNNLPPGHPKEPPGYEAFVRCFSPAAEKEKELPLTGPANKKSQTGPAAKAPGVLDAPLTTSKFSVEKLHRAQDLVYEAWETVDRQRRIDLAMRALKIAPYCADAYNLLAGESRDRQEKLRLYEKAARAGKFALGDLYFQRNTGHFWGLLETRPYMRALMGLAECLWETGQRREAIETAREMLRLNPNDNQGVRYILASWLLTENRNEECRRLLADYEDDIACFLIYSKALLAFRTRGAGGEADEYLQEAVRRNKYVPPYLLGQKRVPFQLPDYYGLGDEREAVIYAHDGREAWRNTPGALEWLERALQDN